MTAGNSEILARTYFRSRFDYLYIHMYITAGVFFKYFRRFLQQITGLLVACLSTTVHCWQPRWSKSCGKSVNLSVAYCHIIQVICKRLHVFIYIHTCGIAKIACMQNRRTLRFVFQRTCRQSQKHDQNTSGSILMDNKTLLVLF